MTVTHEQLLEDAKLILTKVLKIKPEEITPESKLQDDLGIDSVDFWDIMAAFDKKYGFKISMQEAAALITVVDLIKILGRKKQELQKK